MATQEQRDWGDAQTPVMTEKQLAWISEQTERAAARAAKGAVRQWAKRAAVGFVVLALGVAGAFYTEGQHANDQRVADKAARQAIVDSGRAVATVGCNRDFRQTRKFRVYVRASNTDIDRYVAEGTLTPAQGERAKKRTGEFLATIRLPDCRKAQNSVTANPNEKIVVPEPLYVGYRKG